jgi:ribosomal protein S27E
VCGYCQSTVVRDGEVLRRIGKMAELFDDHSLLQLGASGQIDGQGFTLVGRLQYTYREGRWTEWEALLADGSSGTLSEDNGAYVFSRPQPMQRALPAPEHFRVAATTAINGETYAVTSNETVSLLAAQGELPRLPPLGRPFAMVELRSQGSARVLGIDYGTQPPTVSLGRPVALDELKMTGLKSESAKEEKGRHFNCPNCGSAVTVALAASRSITCPSCNSVIDLGSGVGAELRHAEQHEPVRPLIPLGSSGQLQGVDWQVVGFQHRMGHEPGDSDEHFGWDEYLLYNARRGFSFLVDAEDGWSQVKPTTGAPVLAANGQSATYLGTTYALQYAYNAETTYVAGEFYWQVQRGQTTFNRDFAAGNSLLSMEQSPNEVTWSSGSKIHSDTVATAFGLADRKALLQRADASPLSAASGVGIRAVIIMVVLLVLLLLILSRCSQCDPRVENCSAGSSRSSGGSFGGFSTGGGHK